MNDVFIKLLSLTTVTVVSKIHVVTEDGFIKRFSPMTLKVIPYITVVMNGRADARSSFHSSFE